MSAIQSQQSTARARTQARKKANDDAAYLGPSNVAAVGSKRQATDRAEGEQGRMKRKRVDLPHVLAASGSSKKDIQDGEPPKSLVRVVSACRTTLIVAGRVPAATIARALSLSDTVRHCPTRVSIPARSRRPPQSRIARRQPVPNTPAVTTTHEQTPPRTKGQPRIAPTEFQAVGRGESESSAHSARHCGGPLRACLDCRTAFSRDSRNQWS